MKVIKNFLSFLKRRFKHRDDPMCEQSVIEERRFQCYMHCDKLSNKGILPKIKGPRCTNCGCFVLEKTKYKFEMCPDKPPKWFLDLSENDTNQK